jgi:chromosome segregation ATPase
MAQDLKKSNRNNIRQLPNGNDASHQNQILSALDTLGAKLVRSESERDTMRSLLNEALDAQDRLETQLERSSIDISRRIDLMEREDKGLSDEDRQKFEDQFKIVNDNQDALENNQKRQRRVEDKLRDSQQTIAKLQRRLDSQEQKRVKLQRRIERVENIADDAQKALEAKAMVLLTDQSEKLVNLNNMDATAPLQILNDLHQD